MLKKVVTDKAPAAIGPYSQGIIVNGMLFASGQIPIDPATGEIEGTDITAQAERVCKNIGELLSAAGTDYTRVAKNKYLCQIPFHSKQAYQLFKSENGSLNKFLWNRVCACDKIMTMNNLTNRAGIGLDVLSAFGIEPMIYDTPKMTGQRRGFLWN